MLGSLIKFFLGLGLTGTLAVTVATTVYSYYQQNGALDGSGWNMPASISGVPEISVGLLATSCLVLAGGVALITASRPTRSAGRSKSPKAQAT